MRRLLAGGVVASLFLLAECDTKANLPRRKSLSFAPDIHASFITGPFTSPLNAWDSEPDPVLVAVEFISEVSSDDRSSLYIRDDSYTDSNTGITHVDVR